MSSDAGVYATAIGQANGKQWNDDVRLHRTTKFLKALSEPAGMPAVPANGLVPVPKGLTVVVGLTAQSAATTEICSCGLLCLQHASTPPSALTPRGFSNPRLLPTPTFLAFCKQTPSTNAPKNVLSSGAIHDRSPCPCDCSRLNTAGMAICRENASPQSTWPTPTSLPSSGPSPTCCVGPAN